MVAIVTRAGKGSPLTNAEVDANFVNLNNALPATGVGDMMRVNNLSDLLSIATARNNLGLGALATLNAVGAAQITDGSLTSVKWEPSSWFITRNGAGLAFNAGNSFAAAASRWSIYMGGGEAAGNVGNDFVINRNDNAGTYLGTPLTISRADGALVHAGSTIYSNGTINGASVATRGPFSHVTAAGVVRFQWSLSAPDNDLWLSAFNGSGAFIGNPMSIINATMAVAFPASAASPTFYVGATGSAFNLSSLAGAPRITFDTNIGLQWSAARSQWEWFTDVTGAAKVTFTAAGGGIFKGGLLAASITVPTDPGVLIYNTAAGSNRWQIAAAADGAGLAGADLFFHAFDNAGAWQGQVLQLRRDKIAVFSNEIYFTSSGIQDLVEPRGRYWSSVDLGTSTLTLSLQGMLVRASNPTAMVLTIPPASAVNFPAGARIDFVQWDAGPVTFVPGAGVVLVSSGNKRKMNGPYSGVSLTKIGGDAWLLVGDLIA